MTESFILFLFVYFNEKTNPKIILITSANPVYCAGVCG